MKRTKTKRTKYITFMFPNEFPIERTRTNGHNHEYQVSIDLKIKMSKIKTRLANSLSLTFIISQEIENYFDNEIMYNAKIAAVV